MPGTFVSELATRGGVAAYWVTVSGWGRRRQTLGLAPPPAYRLSTLHPGRHGWATAGIWDEAHSFVPILQPFDGELEAAINPLEGTCSLGQLSFDLIDNPPSPLGADVAEPHGWLDDLVTDLLAFEGPPATSPGSWALAADVAALDTNLILADLTGLVPGMALWIGAETVWITQVNPGTSSIDVVRGIYGTTASPHLASPLGEGVLFDRPRFVWLRKVELWMGLFDSRAGHEDELLPTGEAKRIWTGLLDDWQMADENHIRLVCKQSLGDLDVYLGRERVSGKSRLALEGHVEELMESGQAIGLDLEQSSLEGEQGTNAVPAYPPDADGVRHYHARLGDQLIEAQYLEGRHKGVAWGLGGTDLVYEGDTGLSFWDVLCADPDLDLAYCVDETGVSYGTNPLDLALMLMTSTGTKTWGGATGTNGNWDVLPRGWGAGIPQARINLQAFRDLRDRLSGVDLRDLRIGWDGKPVHLRTLLEEQILGPFGVFLFQDEDGLVCVATIGELYPRQTWPEILESDLEADDGGPRVEVHGQLTETLSGVTWQSDFDADDKPQRIVITRSIQVAEREQEGAGDLELQVRGVRDSGFVEGICSTSVANFARWFTTPYPRIVVTVGLHKLATRVTSGVLLTCSWIPNPWTGTRGLTRQPCAVTNRGTDPIGGTVKLELLLQPPANLKLWGPTVRVVAWNAGLNEATCEANAFTRPDGPTGVPVRDVLAFEVNYLCMVTTGDFDVLSADTNVVVSAVEPGGVANRLRFSGPFSVVPAAGNLIRLLRYQTGTAPAAAWTTRMKDFAVQARQSTGLLPNGDPPVVYGSGG